MLIYCKMCLYYQGIQREEQKALSIKALRSLGLFCALKRKLS